MEKKLLTRMVVLAIIAVISMGAMLVASISVTDSTPKACKESMQECSKKEKDADAGSSNDFENLTGKFFSSISY